MRPLVVLLVFHATAGAATRARRDDAIEAAVALELIHSATLLHDDIIDGGETRRGRPSALQRFGLADTLVAGDFLFCRAFALCARFEAEVVRWAAEACVSLTEGEVLQGRRRRDPGRDASPTTTRSSCARPPRSSPSAPAPRPISRAPSRPSVEAMAACGQHVGLAFQMRDDLLDVEGQPADTGKPRGIDLRDGNPSLPDRAGPRSAIAELQRLFADARPAAAPRSSGGWRASARTRRPPGGRGARPAQLRRRRPWPSIEALPASPARLGAARARPHARRPPRLTAAAPRPFVDFASGRRRRCRAACRVTASAARSTTCDSR